MAHILFHLFCPIIFNIGSLYKYGIDSPFISSFYGYSLAAIFDGVTNTHKGMDGPVDVIIAPRCRGQAPMGGHHSGSICRGGGGGNQRRLGVTGFD